MANCDRCGGYVSRDYVRVFGDNEGRIECCPDCPTDRTGTDTDASEESERRMTFRMSDFETGEPGGDEPASSEASEIERGRFGRIGAAVSGLF